jgi:hypothetical protein
VTSRSPVGGVDVALLAAAAALIFLWRFTS